MVPDRVRPGPSVTEPPPVEAADCSEARVDLAAALAAPPGAPAALSGVMIRALAGPRGQFDAEDVAGAARPDSVHAPRSRLVVVENTQNRGGGSVWPMEKIRRVTGKARELGLRLHLDGARL